MSRLGMVRIEWYLGMQDTAELDTSHTAVSGNKT